ncbi:hypothetical protein CPJCM30710_19420 [Clostridium polyendosporum]|uniref:Lipoprotein n=1 Tax=Clostridium polyendosporum TaxID=69208 RepID=A0A919S0Y8_9CLOT|nr:hypothetical protein CPJCM30710_19420 [Clostridium polyendosporum]
MIRKLGILFTCFIMGLLITVACTKKSSTKSSVKKLEYNYPNNVMIFR